MVHQSVRSFDSTSCQELFKKVARSFLVAGLVAVGLSTQAHALAVYGLTDSGSLVAFDSASPTSIRSTVAVSGLGSGTSLVGIDFRPATGQLYGLSSDSRLYTINLASGLATAVGSAGAFTLGGGSYGFDFNPTVDRIRAVSTTDQNLRLNPNDGTLAATDGTLAYAAGDRNAGANPNIAGAAYTNSFAGATTTTLYDIDSALGILVTQAPPNNGLLNTVGALGVATSANIGFDIFFFGNQAFASLGSDAAGYGFYGINLATGAASLIGSFGNGLLIRDIAIAQVPEPSTMAIFGMGLLGLGLQLRRKRA